MCSYCNGLEIVIGRDGRPKDCPVCASAEADRAWIAAHWIDALLHALRLGCPDDDDCIGLDEPQEIAM